MNNKEINKMTKAECYKYGESIGIKKGINQEKITTVRKMIQEGFRQNVIHAVTEIPIEKIINIRQTEKFDEELIKENRDKRYTEALNEALYYNPKKLLMDDLREEIHEERRKKNEY